MLITTTDSCGCRGCGKIIRSGLRISWIEGSGPFHLDCSPLKEDRSLAKLEQEAANRKMKLHAEEKEMIFKSQKRKAKIDRAIDVICFVVGPVLIAANIPSYLDREETRYSDAPALFISLGIGLFAIGILRIYWAKYKSR